MEDVFDWEKLNKRLNSLLQYYGINPEDIKPMTSAEILERLKEIEYNMLTRASK